MQFLFIFSILSFAARNAYKKCHAQYLLTISLGFEHTDSPFDLLNCYTTQLDVITQQDELLNIQWMIIKLKYLLRGTIVLTFFSLKHLYFFFNGEYFCKSLKLSGSFADKDFKPKFIRNAQNNTLNTQIYGAINNRILKSIEQTDGNLEKIFDQI